MRIEIPKLANEKTILLFDLLHEGHHLYYISLFVQAFRKKGWCVVFASTPSAFASEEYRQLLRSQESEFQALHVKVKSQKCHNRLLQLYHQVWELHQTIRQTKPDVVFLPHLDRHFTALCLYGILAQLVGYGPQNYHGILFSGAYAYDEKPRTLKYAIKEWLAKLILRIGSYRRVLFLDRVVYEHFSAKIKTHTIIGMCPDPVENVTFGDRAKFRRDIGIPAGVKVLGTFGHQTARKGCDLLLRAFAAYAPNENEYLLIVGKLLPEIRQVLNEIQSSSSPCRNIVVLDRFVSNEEFLCAVGAVDVVVVPYPAHYASSALVIRAAAANRPILASEAGWPGRMVKKFGLGRTCDVLCQESFVEGIRWAFGEPSLVQQNAATFVSQNTVESFFETITSDLDVCFSPTE